jgi:hypothetical protein
MLFLRLYIATYSKKFSLFVTHLSYSLIQYVRSMKKKNQLDATYCSITLMKCSTCFGHHYAHHQELTTVSLITTWTA